MKRATLVALMLAASPAWGQSPQPSGGDAERARVRYHMQVMERVLEQAVQNGARVLGGRLQSVTPSVFLFAGPVRARGFRLDGYGVFFDVEVPALRESLTWSFRMLNQGDLGLENAIAFLRSHMPSIQDASARANLQRVVDQLEAQVAGGGLPPVLGRRSASVGAQTTASPGHPSSPSSPNSTPPDDPVDAYTSEVRRALVEAVLDYGGTIPLAADDWMTIAARDAGTDVAPGELHDASTIMLRVRGGDLLAFKTGQLTREEARKRVEEVREF